MCVCRRKTHGCMQLFRCNHVTQNMPKQTHWFAMKRNPKFTKLEKTPCDIVARHRPPLMSGQHDGPRTFSFSDFYVCTTCPSVSPRVRAALRWQSYARGPVSGPRGQPAGPVIGREVQHAVDFAASAAVLSGQPRARPGRMSSCSAGHLNNWCGFFLLDPSTRMMNSKAFSGCTSAPGCASPTRVTMPCLRPPRHA